MYRPETLSTVYYDYDYFWTPTVFLVMILKCGIITYFIILVQETRAFISQGHSGRRMQMSILSRNLRNHNDFSGKKTKINIKIYLENQYIVLLTIIRLDKNYDRLFMQRNVLYLFQILFFPVCV